MSDLRFEKPETTELFKTDLDLTGSPAPWAVRDDGSVVDADGDLVLQIDPERARSDFEVSRIGALLMIAVNTCAGFRAELSESATGDDSG